MASGTSVTSRATTGTCSARRLPRPWRARGGTQAWSRQSGTRPRPASARPGPNAGGVAWCRGCSARDRRRAPSPAVLAARYEGSVMKLLGLVRAHALALPLMAKFALAMAVIVGVPRLSRAVGLPGVVGLLLAGILFGPHGLDVFGEHPVIADFFSDLGKLLLMFFAGLEIDLAVLRRARTRSMVFGLATTLLPLLTGTLVGLWFGYGA